MPMKKITYIALMLITGFTPRAFAGSGAARDEMAFLLVISGILLLIAGLIGGIDYLQKNGRSLVRRTILWVRRSMDILFGYFRKNEAGFSAIEPFK